MRHPFIAAAAALTLAAAACSDAVAPPTAAPDAPSLTRGAPPASAAGKVTICHAAGRAGTTKYVEITVSRNAASAHIDDRGTTRAGHEQDFYVTAHRKCPSSVKVIKTLVNVYSAIVNGHMIVDPTWKLGQPVVIPRGEIRWLEFRIDYVLPNGVTGTITENGPAVCATAGTGTTCDSPDFDTRTIGVFNVTGSGSRLITLDIGNQKACGDRKFTNTAVLTPTNGTPVSASSSVVLRFKCS